jgi:hypothetical protein
MPSAVDSRAQRDAVLAALQHELAASKQEIEQLQRLAAACCPWWEQRWHRPH